MKRLTNEEATLYYLLDTNDPLICKKAVGFTLTPSLNQYPVSLSGASWEEVSYYGDPNADYSVSPLEIMLNEWNTQKKDYTPNLGG